MVLVNEHFVKNLRKGLTLTMPPYVVKFKHGERLRPVRAKRGESHARRIGNAGTDCYSGDCGPDFWRRDGIRYPSHAGRFTGEPAYFAHVMGAAKRLFDITKTEPSDFDYCVFHMPNGKFPRQVAVRLGFTKEQLAPSLIVDDIGNPYSASSMTGLAAVLDIAKPGEKIFMVSYGSGAGSDGFIFETTGSLKKQQTVRQQIEKKTYIDYVQYLKQTHKI